MNQRSWAVPQPWGTPEPGGGRDGCYTEVVDFASDPVRARRRRIARLAAWGRAVGFGLFGVALAALAVGMAARFTTIVAAVATAGLIAGSVVLAPAIVAGYGVRAAEREDPKRR